jgi:hypothetical protein
MHNKVEIIIRAGGVHSVFGKMAQPIRDLDFLLLLSDPAQ